MFHLKYNQSNCFTIVYIAMHCYHNRFSLMKWTTLSKVSKGRFPLEIFLRAGGQFNVGDVKRMRNE